MSDLISRQAAIAEFSCCELTPDGGIDADYAIDFLEHLPSVQPEKAQLSQEDTTFDCISRQAAISNCKARLYESALNSMGHECQAYEVFIDIAEHRIGTWLEELPSAQPYVPDTNAGDLISRQAAIDVMINSRSNADVTLVPGSYTNGWRDGRKLLLDELLQVVFELPSVQPEPIWGLPVSADRPLADVEIVSRLRDIQKQIPGGSYAIDRAIEIIEAVASAQPEIIVCADCKHWVCHDRRCGYWNHGVKPLMWCSQAERRTDESEK